MFKSKRPPLFEGKEREDLLKLPMRVLFERIHIEDVNIATEIMFEKLIMEMEEIKKEE